MKSKKAIFISVFTAFFLLFSTSAASAKVMCGKNELKKGQIGRVTILTNVNAVNVKGDTLTQGKRLVKGEEYRVYSYKKIGDSYYYGLGGSLFIKKATSIKFETPSKAKLQLLQWEKIKPNVNLPYGETIQLKDGRVMILAEEGNFIYDYKTNKWSKAAHTLEDLNVSPVLFQDGRVLALTGPDDISGDGPYDRAEIYNPKTNKWSLAGKLNTIRDNFVRGVVMADGRVMIAGGTYSGKDVEIYDPKTNKWSKEAEMKYSTNYIYSFIPLKDGKILSVGGTIFLDEEIGWGFHKTTTALEIYDPKTNTWDVHTIDENFNVAEKLFYLSDGTIFVTGDHNPGVYNMEREEYKPVIQLSQMSEMDTVDMKNGKVLITGVNTQNYNQPVGYIYDVKTKNLEKIEIPANSPLLFMLPNGKALALRSNLWEIKNGSPIRGTTDSNAVYLYTPAK